MILKLAAITVNKILRRAERRVVGLADAFYEIEGIPELIVHRFGAVADHIEAAAFLRAVDTERRNDNMSAGLKDTHNEVNIFAPVGVVSKKVENGAVVWGDPEEISGANAQVVWSQNPGDPDERRVVWSNVVRPFLEGEIQNGTDDNQNGLIDEKGLNFTLQGNRVTIRLTLERARNAGSDLCGRLMTRVSSL